MYKQYPNDWMCHIILSSTNVFGANYINLNQEIWLSLVIYLIIYGWFEVYMPRCFSNDKYDEQINGYSTYMSMLSLESWLIMTSSMVGHPLMHGSHFMKCGCDI
mgnify:CR=1 FL=1